jgi:hypothetical protein
LKLQYDEPLSNIARNCKLRRYSTVKKADRPYTFVVYGASGYTGSLILVGSQE